ncbi:LOW QUALITY PROTEIN: probable alpha,alpha-trehalose-phosphate synthase [UDP-forming] 8 [Setaria viridis]|uniref:LOW QUALITY PROTEIN: probable alpha,alpha-trehalose-phosphate synthase [UDP-forming] 8 n=1 Tax=Setaria viridis TaxID=4556 RepID=UPI003B3B5F1C
MQGSSSSSCVNKPSLAPPVPGADGPPAARRIVAAHRLPLRASPDPDSPFGFAFSLDPDAPSLQLSRGFSPAPVTYIGTLPASVESKIVPSDELNDYLMENFSCLPVHLDGGRHAEFYDGFCKRYLWPLLHYLLPFTVADAGNLYFDEAEYRAFIAANRQFADRVIQVLSPDDGDLVIVHDYHLWALPTFLRRKCPRAAVGLFLHTPFPSAEILSSVAVCDELLRGLLNADLVGFHTSYYAHQFVSCCWGLLGVSYNISSLHGGHVGINYHGRTVLVKTFTVGVDMGRLRATLASPEAAAKAKEIAEAYRGRVLMVGVDDVDPFKGVGLKLLALEKMLEADQDMRRRVVLVQINNPARSAGGDADDVRSEAAQIERRINRRFGDGGELVVAIDGPVPMWVKAAYYAAADCCVVTAVRDGLNRIPYFYTVCREEGARRGGAVVVSQFAGCAASLGGAIRVNPLDPAALADAMRAAVTMDAEERQARHSANYGYLRAHDVADWARSFDKALNLACRDHAALLLVGFGLGLGYRAMALRPRFQALTAEHVRPSYRDAACRLILLDYDGTMVPEQQDERKGAPDAGIVRLLNELCADPKNVVFLVSGRGKSAGGVVRFLREARHLRGAWLLHKVKQQFNNSLPSFSYYFFFEKAPSVITDLGQRFEIIVKNRSRFEIEIDCIATCLYKICIRWSKGDPWEVMNKQVVPGGTGSGWKAVAERVMRQYMEATAGSYMETKETALAWHYQNADPVVGPCQAKELHDHLVGLLADEPASVAIGSQIVEVNPQGVNKGVAVRGVLSAMSRRGVAAPDLALCFGDGEADEDMFEALARSGARLAAGARVFACTVGKKATEAAFYVEEPADVVGLLRALARCYSY